jgi:nitrate reductase cytochrome c-type subunit
MTTVADLYTSVIGRAPDAGGLAYWEQMFGPTVDATEASTFLSVAKQTEPTKSVVSTADIQNWLISNPTASDAEIAAAANIAGVSASQLAVATGLDVDKVISRITAAAPEAATIVNQAKTTENPLNYVSQVASLPDTITDYRGKTYDVDTLKSLASQLSSISDAKNLSGGAYGEKEGNIGFAYKDLAGALGASPTSFDQVLMDAARQLVDQGITDINQIKPPEGADANYTGNGVGAGETYTGPGSTSYAVDFKDGKPYFKTTGNSSSFFDSDLGKAALVAGAYFGAPYLSEAIAGATGLTGAGLAGATGAAIGGTTAAVTGNDIVKGAVLGGGLGYGGGLLSENVGATTTPTGTTEAGGATSTASSGAGYYDEIKGKFIPAEYGQLQGPLTNASGTGGLEGYSYDSATRTWTLPDGSKVDLSYLPNSETALTGAQIMQNAGAIAPATSSLTASQVIKALPLIPVVNQLTGDPLGLNPDLPTTTTPGGTSGNPIVPIPPEWKPPTYPGTNLTGQPNYTGAFNPIDLNSIFTDQNLLTGTQWQGLPNQRNMTFNDIFAAGQQSTPMGTPVNINNIVSAILGQTATSQKPA